MPEEKIGVVGIRIQDGPVGPEGNHLRWSFPAAFGFPRHGFEIYRRDGGAKPKEGLSFASLPLNTPLPADQRINGVGLTANPSGGQLRCQSVGVNRVLTITPGTQAQLELRFPNPIVHLRVEVSGTQPNTLRVFDDNILLAQTSAGGQVREIYCSEIRRATVDLGANQLRSIAFTTQASTLNLDWQLVKELKLPVDQSGALKLLENELKNHYATSVAAARARYETGAAEIALWLKRLISPDAEHFDDPTARPDQLRLLSKEKEVPGTAIYLQSIFLLAALDPNLARMMALYWVDAFKPDAPGLLPPPKKDAFYDYRVNGLWTESACPPGLLMHIGPPAAPLPHIKPELVGEQLRGIAWRDQKPVGRIGLKWSRPIVTGGSQDRAVAPVLYDLARTFRDKTERIPEPILVDGQAWKQSSSPVVYVDRDLPLGEYGYEVRPIDLFGQVGKALKSNPIKVVDNEAPPPPVRTRTLLTQSNSSAEVRLQFEFGAFQHQQAPDVEKFNLYWRADSLIDRLKYTATVVSVAGIPGNFVHTLRITNTNDPLVAITPWDSLIGDVLTNVISGTVPPLPADQRRRFRIASAIAPDIVELEPAPSVMSNGNYELVRDPHNRGSWTRLSREVKWREPVQGTLTQTRQAFSASVSNVVPDAPPLNPFAFLPAAMRGRHFPPQPPVEPILQVEVDRLLVEPDIFAGGTAQIGTNTFSVKYVVSSLTARKTRIGLPANATVAVGDTLELRPPADFAARVRSLRIGGAIDGARIDKSGGELVFERDVNDQSVTEILRAISDARNVSGSFEVLVLAESSQAIQALRPNETRFRYYVPFVVTLPVSLANGAEVSLPIAADQGLRDGFVAVTATDVRDNQGPLSTSAQFTVTRPRPSGAPDRPYPCGLDVTAPAGYATPPNRSGRATICLAWDTGNLDPAEGARYEVARALDSAITAAHLRDWQLGKITIDSPVVNGPGVSGAIANVRVENGMLRALFTPLLSGATAENFRHGRIAIENRYFQVTLAKFSGNAIDLALRGPTEPLPGSGIAFLEAPPNYDQAFLSNDALQSLALQVSDAFALVTGVPIDRTQFIDDVAGVGRSRFFYRVRAVDAAENRSDWSRVSAPFHQVDTTPPRAPAVTHSLSGEQQVTLRWQPDRLDTIHRYEIQRSTRRGASELPASLAATATTTLDVETLPPGEIEFIDQVPGLRADESYVYSITAIKRVRKAIDPNEILEVRSFPSANIVGRALDSSPALPPFWYASEWWNLQTNAIADATTEDPVVRLVWATVQPQTRCTLYRRRLGETLWRQVAGSLVSSGINAAGEFEFLVFDPHASPAEDHEYQVEVLNRLNRKNDQFVPVLLRRHR